MERRFQRLDAPPVAHPLPNRFVPVRCTGNAALPTPYGAGPRAARSGRDGARET
ncbi:hypothetical protein R75461_07312 [Paraburkholderia nemoris]|nr:hypothetical protein R75461_07312 [Paraburkholderia nemoris]